MARFIAFRIAAALVVGTATMPAAAQGWHDRDWERDRHVTREHPWQGPEFERWRHGRWWHGPHGGHVGWWWVVGGDWYFYPAPVYPYPDPYLPPVVAAPVPPPAAPPVYYWCDHPRGYYPAVPACRAPWRAVPAAPPPR
jgi:hypothetical protein